MRGIVPIRFVSLKDKTPVGEIMRQTLLYSTTMPEIFSGKGGIYNAIP